MPYSYRQLLFEQRGIALALLAALIFSVNSLSNNIMPERVSVPMIVFWNVLFFLPAILFLRWDLNENYRTRDVLIISLTALLGLIAMSFGVAALTSLAVGDASAIIFSKPLFCAIIGRLFLKDTFSAFDAGILLLNLVGAVLVAKPPFLFHTTSDQSAHRYHKVSGLTFAMASAVCWALNYTGVRKLTEKAIYDPSLMLIAQTTIGFLLYAVFLLLGSPSSQSLVISDLGFLAVSSVTNVLALGLIYLSLKSQTACVVSLVATVEVAGAYFLQATFTTDIIGWESILGSILICLSPVWFSVKGLVHRDSE